MDLAVNRLTTQSFTWSQTQSAGKAQVEAMTRRMVAVADRARAVDEARELAELRVQQAEDEAARVAAAAKEAAAGMERERAEMAALRESTREAEAKAEAAARQVERVQRLIGEQAAAFEKSAAAAAKAQSEGAAHQVRNEKLKRKVQELTTAVAQVARGGDRALRDELQMLKTKCVQGAHAMRGDTGGLYHRTHRSVSLPLRVPPPPLGCAAACARSGTRTWSSPSATTPFAARACSTTWTRGTESAPRARSSSESAMCRPSTSPRLRLRWGSVCE